MRIDIKKILCPVDFSESSDHAVRYGRAFAETYGSALVLMHVFEIPHMLSSLPEIDFPMDELKEEYNGKLDKMVAKYGGEDCDISRVIEAGEPSYEIVWKAKEEDFDLIVIGTHGHSKLKHMLIGSVAEKVVRQATCPVLSVKHPEHEFITP